MGKQAHVQTGPEQDPATEQKIQRLRELFADAPQEEGVTFTIPRAPVRRRIHGIETFNVLRGGEYLFMPSSSALKGLDRKETQERSTDDD
jgi:hypothetical protein